jgi:acetyl esterase/lipase
MIPYSDLVALETPAAEIREAYGAGPQQFGELRIPDGARSKRPVIVFIHGGCWQAEYDLKHAQPAAAALASEGYVVWLPEYRRLGDAGGGWPGTFDDVGTAIDHLRALAKKYPQVDTTRVILAGHSAGGQLALWGAGRSATNASALEVQGVVGLAAISDMATYGATRGGCNASVTPLLGGTAAQVPERYRAVSPIEHLPLGVPVRLVHGSGDAIVPPGMSETYAARAKAAGDRADVTLITGAGHFDVIAPQTSAWKAVVAALRGIISPG